MTSRDDKHCPCADPENCKEPISGYRCRRTERTVSSIGTLEGLPNLRAIIDGRVSGHYTEWPMVRAELREMVTQWERALGDLNLALHAELLDTGLVTAEQWNEAIAPKLKACGQAIRMQDRAGQRSAPVSATLPPSLEVVGIFVQRGGRWFEIEDRDMDNEADACFLYREVSAASDDTAQKP